MNRVHIVTEPVSLIKQIARDALKGHWKQVFIAMFIYALLTDFIATILDTIFPSYRTLELYGQTLTINQSFVGGLYTTILVGAFTYGITLYLLTFYRTRKTDNSLIFEGFSMPGKTILLQIVIAIRVALWALLFVIPGIIAAFRYSMAYYILADHPDYSITQCIEESKARMNGNKMTLFVLLISFIGWAILASVVGQGLLTMFGSSTVGSLIGFLVGSIPNIFLAVYTQTSETVFYELLTENLVVMTPDQEVRNQGVNPDNMVNAAFHVNNNPNEAYDDVSAETTENTANGPYDYVKAETTENTANGPYDEVRAETAENVSNAAYDEVKAEDIANDAMKAAEDALRELRSAAGAGPVEHEDVKPSTMDEVDQFGAPKDEPDDL